MNTAMKITLGLASLGLASGVCIGLSGKVYEAKAEGEEETSLSVSSEEETASSEIASSEEASSEIASSEETPAASSEDGSDAETDFDWQEWLADLVSPSTLATITAIVTALVAVLKLCKSVKDMAKSKQLTVEAVQEQVVSALKECVSEDVAKTIDEYLPTLVSASQKTDRILQSFAKILALSQENTAESKLAILNAIQELGLIADEAIETAKAEVSKQASEAEADAQAKADAVSKVIEETEAYDGTSV